MADFHIPIMRAEVLQHLRPQPGEIAVDCTLGGGSHAIALLERVQPRGRVIALDMDPIELRRAEARIRLAGFAPDTFTAHHANFADLPRVLAEEGVPAADVILADLGVSAMQHDDPYRGFGYKVAGPLDMRMDPTGGEPAAQLLRRLDENELSALLTENADEPHAVLIARTLKRQVPESTNALERIVRTAINHDHPQLAKSQVKMSVRRTFQALRIAVNDEFSALDALLRALPGVLAAGGRVAVLTFHSGEDRRVKKAFQAGHRDGVYAATAREVVRSAKAETFSNRRAAAAKLRWAVRAG